MTVNPFIPTKGWWWSAYSKATYSVDSLNLKYPCNRWSDSHGVLALSLEHRNWKPCVARMYSFEEIFVEVSLQNKRLNCRLTSITFKFSFFPIENIVLKEKGKMTANMYMMRYIILCHVHILTVILAIVCIETIST